jgi:hypothetical protein
VSALEPLTGEPQAQATPEGRQMRARSPRIG